MNIKRVSTYNDFERSLRFTGIPGKYNGSWLQRPACQTLSKTLEMFNAKINVLPSVYIALFQMYVICFIRSTFDRCLNAIYCLYMMVSELFFWNILSSYKTWKELLVCWKIVFAIFELSWNVALEFNSFFCDSFVFQ